MMEGHYNKALLKNRKNLIKILATSRMHMYILENLIEIKNELSSEIESIRVEKS